jgi:membrane protease YdiL (CAAX protease family)
MKIREFARRHPVGLYFTFAFAISWVGTLLTAGPMFVRGDTPELQDLAGTGIAMLAGPFLAGLAMTYLVKGSPGIRDLFSRIIRWRVAGRWYAALLIFPILILAISLALSAWAFPELRPTFFAPGILMGLFAGLVEEVGWMGFAFPMMKSKRSILATGIYLGFLHALWHIVADFLGNYRAFGWYWLPCFAGFFVFVIALRVLIVWVYANTESLLLAQLMHASSSGFLSIFIPIGIAGVDWAVFYGVYAVVLSAVALIVVARYGHSLTRQPGNLP